ncbi:MAG: DUF6807 family protein [Capsulimonadales bacterium]|nr:DUF6807 family protein [Capsulimonadales bacterium]
MRVIHEIGECVSVEIDGVERLRYRYPVAGRADRSLPRPFFSPIRTPDGIEITAHSPVDHFWHRGLWFTYKYVNRVNYWEENQEIVGRQVVPESAMLTTDIDPGRSRVRWAHPLSWIDARDGQTIERLREDREITVESLSDGALVLTLRSAVTPAEETTLDRTPFSTWGGYGGLYVRMTQALQKQRLVLAGETPTESPRFEAAAVGSRHRWAGIEGRLDTDADIGERWAAFVFLPSTRNRRYPEPFYGDARPFYNFFGPAPLFAEPIVLTAGETFVYEVRTLILPRRIDIEEVERHFETWNGTQTP